MDLRDATPSELAENLMRGDDRTLKAGYSPESAVLAVAALRELSRDEALDLARAVGADIDLVARCIDE